MSIVLEPPLGELPLVLLLLLLPQPTAARAIAAKAAIAKVRLIVILSSIGMADCCGAPLTPGRIHSRAAAGDETIRPSSAQAGPPGHPFQAGIAGRAYVTASTSVGWRHRGAEDEQCAADLTSPA